MQRIRTLIVDDERLSRQALRVLLARDHEVEIVGEASDGEAALSLIHKLHPRLLFLDVHMPLLNGLEMLGRLAEAERPEVVFVTAHEDYARPAFDVCAVDYLMKPFSDTRFAQALERAKKRLADTSLKGTERALRELLKQLQRTASRAGGSQSPFPVPNSYQRIVVKSDGQLHFLHQREIRWVKAQGDYAKIHLKTRSLLVRITMSRIEKMLDPAQFFRIHKSTIVNLENVRRVLPMLATSRGMELDDGTTLPIGASYRAAIEHLRSKGDFL
jgi:two-component system LytT family response regulator